MTTRYTKKDAQRAFERLCRLLGQRIAATYNDVGAWELDHNTAYGGYVVNEVSSVHGGISKPMGDRRRSAQELWWFVHDLEELERHGIIRADAGQVVAS